MDSDLQYTCLRIEEDATCPNDIDPNDWYARVDAAAECVVEGLFLPQKATGIDAPRSDKVTMDAAALIKAM